MTHKQRLECLILDVLEASSNFCMDDEEEREALADTLAVDVLGQFDLKLKSNRSSVLARVLPPGRVKEC